MSKTDNLFTTNRIEGLQTELMDFFQVKKPDCTGEAIDECVKCRYRKDRIEVLHGILMRHCA